METRRTTKPLPAADLKSRPRTPVNPLSHMHHVRGNRATHQQLEPTVTSVAGGVDAWAKQAERVDRWVGRAIDPQTQFGKSSFIHAGDQTQGDQPESKSVTEGDANKGLRRTSKKSAKQNRQAAEKDPKSLKQSTPQLSTLLRSSPSGPSPFLSISPRMPKLAPPQETIPVLPQKGQKSPRDEHSSARSSNLSASTWETKRFLDPTTLKFKCTVSATISDAMRRRGWKQVVDDNDDTWNIYWCDMGQLRELYYRLSKPLEDNQRIGHFRNSFEISRKNLMARNLRRFKSKMEKQFGRGEGEKLNFFPQTFILPEEHSKFLDEFRRDPTVWVIKPAAGAQGRGIFIFSKLKDYYIWRATFDPIESQRRKLAKMGIDMKNQPDGRMTANDMTGGQQPPAHNKYRPVIFGPGGVYLDPTSPRVMSATSDATSDVDTNNNVETPAEPEISLEKDVVCIDSNHNLALLSTYQEPTESDVIQAGDATARSRSESTERAKSTSDLHDQDLEHNLNLPVLDPPSMSTTHIPTEPMETDFPEPVSFAGDTDDDVVDPDADPLGTNAGTNVPLARNEIFVVQKYILNPYLLGGRKFDLRLYILVESFAPLKIWVHREGFVRFSGGQYNVNTLQDIYVHLTNVAIQKTSDNYDFERGSKWPLYELRAFLLMSHGPKAVHELFSSIDNIIIRTLQSAQHAVYHDRHCFEVYGFDILIDDTLKAWLLEVNSSPAFTPSSEQDYRLKCSIIDDVMHVLDIERRLTGFEKRVGGFDLIWNGGPVYSEERDFTVSSQPKLNSFIGCYNDRVNQLFSLFQLTSFAYGVQCLNATPTSAQESNGELKPPRPDENQVTMPEYIKRAKADPMNNATPKGEFVPIDISRIGITNFTNSSKEMDDNFKVPVYPYLITSRGQFRTFPRVNDPMNNTGRTNMNKAAGTNYTINRRYPAIPNATDIAQLVQSQSTTPWSLVSQRPKSQDKSTKGTARSTYGNSTSTAFMGTISSTPSPPTRNAPSSSQYKSYVNDLFTRLSGSGSRSSASRKLK